MGRQTNIKDDWQNNARNVEIYKRMDDETSTLRSVAAEFELSYERIRQLVKREKAKRKEEEQS